MVRGVEDQEGRGGGNMLNDHKENVAQSGRGAEKWEESARGGKLERRGEGIMVNNHKEIAVQSQNALGVGGGESPVKICGNGVREAGEGCDDGNVARFDGCSHACQLEAGWRCYTREVAEVEGTGEGAHVEAKGEAFGEAFGAGQISGASEDKGGREEVSARDRGVGGRKGGDGRGGGGGGDVCREENPEEVLRVVDFGTGEGFKAGLVGFEPRALCLEDCEKCEALDAACRAYCVDGIAHTYQNCGFLRELGLDCRDRETGKPLRYICLFKSSDAVARCAAHVQCTALSCFALGGRLVGGEGGGVAGVGGGALLHVPARDDEVCLAHRVSLEEAGAEGRVGGRMRVRGQDTGGGGWEEVASWQRYSSMSCSTKVLVPAKDRHSEYLMSAPEAVYQRVALEHCEDLVRQVAANRTAVQQRLNLIGRGDIKEHGQERRLISLIQSLSDKEAALARECMQIKQHLQVRFRQSTIIQTFSVLEWRSLKSKKRIR